MEVTSLYRNIASLNVQRYHLSKQPSSHLQMQISLNLFWNSFIRQFKLIKSILITEELPLKILKITNSISKISQPASKYSLTKLLTLTLEITFNLKWRVNSGYLLQMARSLRPLLAINLIFLVSKAQWTYLIFQQSLMTSRISKSNMWSSVCGLNLICFNRSNSKRKRFSLRCKTSIKEIK